ncbi:MAG: hypothetical protein R2823_09465 [Acidimicrobiia bacterium]
MKGTRTVGFSIAEADSKRLERLTRIFGQGNRSQFLRVAMDEMERIERAERLKRLQAYGAERAASLDAPITAVEAVREVLKSRR